MSQTEKIDQTATTSTTSMIIPANSQLVYCRLICKCCMEWICIDSWEYLGYVGDATAFTAGTQNRLVVL